jgi:hypothetical protein
MKDYFDDKSANVDATDRGDESSFERAFPATRGCSQGKKGERRGGKGGQQLDSLEKAFKERSDRRRRRTATIRLVPRAVRKYQQRSKRVVLRYRLTNLIRLLLRRHRAGVREGCGAHLKGP